MNNKVKHIGKVLGVITLSGALLCGCGGNDDVIREYDFSSGEFTQEIERSEFKADITYDDLMDYKFEYVTGQGTVLSVDDEDSSEAVIVILAFNGSNRQPMYLYIPAELIENGSDISEDDKVEFYGFDAGPLMDTPFPELPLVGVYEYDVK